MKRALTDAEQPLVNRHYAPRPKADIPSAGIFDTPDYCVSINAEWLPHVLGALIVLDQPDAWTGTESEIEDARNEIRRLIAAFEACP